MLKLFTDGSCQPNPGVGGWAWVLTRDDIMVSHDADRVQVATNNRMEIFAAVRGLEAIETPEPLDLVSDSQYLVKAFTDGWLKQWSRRPLSNGTVLYLKKNGGEVANSDLWERLRVQTSRWAEVPLNWHWVRGHDGHHWNELADKLATEARDRR